MATDDEIREEVSSVGMESSTLRPIQYPNPFLKVPPPILEDQESASDPSTLSSVPLSKITMTSLNPSKEGKQSKSKKNDIPAASNGSSSKSKKLWKGWKKTLGKVKSIVHDIDEKRIPAPQMTQVQLKKSPAKKKASE
jgi:hypothetical protein